MMQEYVHEEIGSEIDAISGHYVFHKEVKLAFGEREILYVVGSAVIDTSCCGVGGCGFAIVPGYILAWKLKISAEGRYISQVEPILTQSTQQKIIRFIQGAEIVNQVQFL
jgi:hypothetical protein